MSFASTLPKGIRSGGTINYRPARTSGNTWSNELTKKSSNSYNVWLYYDVHPKPSGVTGKNFTFDLVFTYSNAEFFNWPATYVDVAFQFYSIVTQRWTDYFHWDQWLISDYSGISGASIWNNYTTYRSKYRPAWGMFAATKDVGLSITASSPTYAEYSAAAQSVGYSEVQWDATNIHSYSRWIPWGMRYLSNGSNAQPGQRYPDPSPFIYKHGQTSRSLNYSNLDYGGTLSGLKTVDLSAQWIKSKVGTLAGVTAFKMRVRMGWSPLDTNSFCTWYFGGNNPKAEAEDTFTTIDNPQIGLLDWGAKGPKQATWPLRFDAQARYRNRTGTAVKLQAQYKPKGGSWNIF